MTTHHINTNSGHFSCLFARLWFLLEWTEQNSGHHKALVNSGCGISGFLSGLPSISISCIVSFEYFCPFNINIMHHRQKIQYCCFPLTVAHKNNIKDIIGLLDLWLSLSPMDYMKSWANHQQNYLKLMNTVEHNKAGSISREKTKHESCPLQKKIIGIARHNISRHCALCTGKLLIETVTMNMNVYRLFDLDDTAHLSPLLWRNIHNHVWL